MARIIHQEIKDSTEDKIEERKRQKELRKAETGFQITVVISAILYTFIILGGLIGSVIIGWKVLTGQC